jgi:hypothetical protein
MTFLKLDDDGNPVLTKQNTQAIKHYPTYRCTISNHGCGRMRIGAKLLDPFITAEFKKVLERSLKQQRFAPAQLGVARILEIENELSTLAKELVVDYGRLERGVLTEDTYRTVKDEKEKAARRG